MPNRLNVLAIYPEQQEQRVFDPMPPLGLAWIAASVRQAGYPIRIVDEQVESVNISAIVTDTRPSLVLVGGTSHSRFHAFARAKTIKEVHPSATIVYGGPHASFTAEDTLSHVPAIDIIAHGEGEQTISDLLQWKQAGGNDSDLEKIKGIAFRANSTIVSTGWRPLNQDLDLLPPPARDLLQIERYNMTLEHLGLPALHIMTARGCPFRCAFCSAAKMYNNCYAMRSPKLVVDEVEALVDRYGIKGLKVFDSTFTVNKYHVLDFCQQLEERKLAMPWECEVRVGSVDQPLLARMQEAGCYYIDIGIESADQETLNTMHKSIRLSDAEQLLRWCEQLGIMTKVFFTVGHIEETYEAGLKTIRFIRKNRRHMTLIGYNPGIRVYPGTQVEEHARQQKLLPSGFTWSAPYENLDNVKIYLAPNNIPLLLQPQMGIRELRKLRHRYIASRVTSPSFLWTKLGRVLKYKEAKKYAGFGLKGMVAKGKRRSSA